MQIAILKGITVRIVADAYLNDLIVISEEEADNCLRSLDTQIEKRVNRFLQKYNKIIKHNERNAENEKSGLILHLDGDKLYSEKTSRYYKKMGINAVVKNVPENKQPLLVKEYLQKYSPDVLILTRTWCYD